MNSDDAHILWKKYEEMRNALPSPEEMRRLLEQAQPGLDRIDALEQAHQKFQELKTHPRFAEISRQAIAQAMEKRFALQLDFHYDRESDTLTISNGLKPVSSADLSEEILAEFDSDGRPAGFVIDGAAQLLKPYLLEAMLQLDSELPQDG